MRAIVVDDEVYMLEALDGAVRASSDIAHVERFSSCSMALAYAEENPIDVAFLDINMRGIGGLRLAEKLQEEYDYSVVEEYKNKYVDFDTKDCSGQFAKWIAGQL